MGKRKRARSNDTDYDTIRRKIKKLEQKLKNKRRQRESPSSISSEDEIRPNADYEDELDYQGVDDMGEIISNDEENDINNDETSPRSGSSVQIRPSAQPKSTVQLAPPLAAPVTPPVVQPSTSSTDNGVNQSTLPNEVNLTPLHPEILQLLGEDPAIQKNYGEDLHKDIATRWSHILTNGLPKDIQTELIKRYLPPANCLSMTPPKLNLEVKAALPETNVRKDIYSQSKQNQLSSSLAAIGQVLNWALSPNSTVPQNIIKTLSDAGRLICDNYYKESQSRRFAVLNTLNKNIRDTIKNTKIDEHLFGSGLSDHIKSSKVISRTSSELKPPQRLSYKPPPVTQRGALNSRGVPPLRAAAVEPRANTAPRRPPRDRRQDATRGRRITGYTRQPPLKKRYMTNHRYI